MKTMNNGNINPSTSIGIEKNVLENLISEKLTIREMAEKLNVCIATIQYWLKVYGLKTIRGEYRGNPIVKKIIPLLPKGIKALGIDITEVSTIRSRGKQKRITKNSIFTIEMDTTKLAFIMDRQTIHLKEVISQIMLKVTQQLGINIVVGDKEFSYLNDVGIYYFKASNWNCEKQLNDKHYGNLKGWVYPLIQYDKQQLGLNNKDLLECDNMVLDNYITQLKKCGYLITDNRMSEAKQLNQIPQISIS